METPDGLNIGDGRDEWTGHLEELRRRIIKVLVVLVLTTGLAFACSSLLAGFLTAPVADLEVKLYAFGPTDKFMAHLHISLLAGLAATLPYLLLQAGLFLWPGLIGGERRCALFVLIVAPLLFFFGAGAAYRFVAPPAMRFFLWFAAGDGVEPLWGLKEYLSLLSSLMLAFGLLLQLPLALLLLFGLGVVSPARVAEARAPIVLLIFFLAAVATPPDVATQLMLGVPLYLIFELTLLLGKRFYRKKKYKQSPGDG